MLALRFSGSARSVLAIIAALAIPLPCSMGLEAQKSHVQTTGDVLQVAIPAVAFITTVGLHDSEGTLQFLKSIMTNVAATWALKSAIARERPDGSNDKSFPSGHTSAAFQGASFIHLRYGRKKAILAYAGATFVGFSRVYADKHYVSDVVAGAALGTLSSFLFTDRFDRVEVTPATGGGRFGVEIRVGLGIRPHSR